jgi:hypothetical protein
MILLTISVNEVIEMATAVSANASAILLDARNSGLVRCHAAHIKKASSFVNANASRVIKGFFKLFKETRSL